MDRIGIDIGGMSAKLGLVREGRVIEERVVETGAGISYEKFLDTAAAVVAALCEEREVEMAGISSCGLIDSGQGKIVYSNNIGWEDRPIAADFMERTSLPVKVANDAKCAALAEAVYGAGRAYGRVCMVTLGTGVGGGFVCDRSLPTGLYGDADGIMGHITVERGGRQCTCGRKGCLEAYASATAVMGAYQEKTGKNLTAKEIFMLAGEGEEKACEVLSEFRYYLGEGLISLVNVLRPEVVVIGGGLAASCTLFIKEVEEAVNRYAFGGQRLP
ncbi:MAG: ROK family protein, partial [Lachnospiraceae bacterium]|nr:ROK family protein [Lachnospiraceae bacterium]